MLAQESAPDAPKSIVRSEGRSFLVLAEAGASSFGSARHLDDEVDWKAAVARSEARVLPSGSLVPRERVYQVSRCRRPRCIDGWIPGLFREPPLGRG